MVAAVLRAQLVRRDIPSRVSHQALLTHLAGARELTTVGQVLAIGDDVPGCLVLTRVLAAVELGLPLLQVRRRGATPVGVAVRVGAFESAGNRLAECIRPVEGPWIGLRRTVGKVATVVRVARRVDHVSHRRYAVRITVAVFNPDTRTRVPVNTGGSLQGAACSEMIPGHVQAVIVTRHRQDGRVQASIPDLRVSGHWQGRSRSCVEHRKPVSGIA